jgi:hypothetical protein
MKPISVGGQDRGPPGKGRKPLRAILPTRRPRLNNSDFGNAAVPVTADDDKHERMS